MRRAILFISFFIAVLSCKAQNQQSFIKEGNEFFKKGQLAEAVASYNKVAEEPYKYTALLNKGTALYKQKKMDEALKAYNQVSVSPNATNLLKSGAYYNAGVVYSNQNKVEESIEAYKKALRLNSQDNNARENLQKALSELKKSGGGGGSDQKPQQSPSKLNKNQAQQQLDRLEQKEKNTQNKVSNKKTQFGGSVGKDW